MEEVNSWFSYLQGEACQHLVVHLLESSINEVPPQGLLALEGAKLEELAFSRWIYGGYNSEFIPQLFNPDFGIDVWPCAWYNWTAWVIEGYRKE